MAERLPLTAEEERCWRAVAWVMVALPRLLDADLVDAEDLHLSEYSVLMHLSEAPEGRLRMNDLASRLGLSASRVTRLVDGLAGSGLVTKQPCRTDTRGNWAVLLDVGRTRLEQAWPAHLESVRSRVISRADGADLAVVAAVLEGVAAANSRP